MNITELARKLKVNTQELRDKLPEIGFDIGQKAIKVDDKLASRIIRSWREFQDRVRQKDAYEAITNKDEQGKVILDKKVEIPGVLTVRDFAELLKLPVTIVIQELMKNGVMASLNQRIDFDTAAIVAADLGYESSEINAEEKTELDKAQKVSDKLTAEKEEDLKHRAPIVVIMGHVDHGKTKLLDAIRSTDVVAGEAGGITQHIGAYQVEKKGRMITFIDTPGHEAFTAMRSRGAKVADIAVLVVAANEGVKPQTVEALKIAQEAKIPILVAVNKIDLPDANPDKVKQELGNYNLVAEEWGGKTAFIAISAKFNKNIDAILDHLILMADMEEATLRANPDGDFVGSIIESHVNPGAGPVATVLVRNGTLKVGDHLVIDGVLYGKVKVLRDYHGKEIEDAKLSVPAEILGFKIAPKVGDVLEVTDDPKSAAKAKSYKMQKEETFIKHSAEDTESSDDSKITQINLILRADVLGSQEAVIESLTKIQNADIKIKFVSKGLGNITESDVQSAEATGSLILGFNVMPSTAATDLAKESKVEIETFKIIYELIDEVKKRLKELIKPEVVRRDLGKLEVIEIFKKADKMQVVGGKVISGKVESNSKVAVLRGEEFITSGKVTQLQAGKQEVKDCVKGQECGISFEGQPLIEKGDILDIYQEEEVFKSL
ncbi:translation initiation factor IF-2 [Candidatus Falkowbacteria bacterium]|jgi:translation initiation factor IF-2|nr:translation initiation factor IF-2 [Candidatus Falkowbacteria bacterium]MBT6574120.1 translation initiation factor IF-2 [Candidatus Falkowbacteria bacterium]MBT7348733.1 translation initiation factor IF-2 [Candidatus Falkowbacteria bacterium]MBT7500523.1 translation initiation factor IF-2 [Candidatus Falkowbacteria bacterium]